MINGLKSHLYKKRLEEISKRTASTKVPALNRFKNVLLFFDATDTAVRKVIQKYATELEHKGAVVKLFAFVDTKEPNADIGIDHYTSKDINWYQVPNNEDLQLVQDKRYDASISLLSEIKPHHLFVINSINAAMKIGPCIDDSHEAVFDLSVDHKSSLGIPELIKNIKSSIQLLSNGK